ncbi:2TM domain-containing protein [Baaleninema sp.]|uniref:2TM domain-containing protein n=1 Tax=Baaleninema sp. TaxID=3101197 RepID=UPI003D078EEB
MPPKWPGKPDPKDPAYRRLGDRINFALHVAIFAACNSGAWFFYTLYRIDEPWTLWASAVWGAVLFAHGVYVFGLANYSQS